MILCFIKSSLRKINMRSRLFALTRSLTAFRTFVPVRKYAIKADRCDAHMNELPVPCGPWDTWYKDKQSYFNKVLLLGVLWWLFSFGMAIYTESIFLNWGPPAQPGPPSDMVEECEDIE